MLKIIQKSNNPKFLVITPLKRGDFIFKDTKKFVKRNKTSFDWVSYEADNNIPRNTELAMYDYEKIYKPLKYIIKIDNDILMVRGLLDEMYERLSKSDKKIGYCYCPFSYVLPNGQYISFNQKEFDIVKLLKSNYITSNSMIKRKVLDRVDGFVTDEKYVRLLDYALWLKMYYYGYTGICCDKTFVTTLNQNNISARGKEDYNKKMGMIQKDFIIPILQKCFVTN